MGEAVAYIEPRGDRSKGVKIFFQDGDPGGVVVWDRDVGTDSQGGAFPEYFPTQGRETDHQKAAE